MAGAHDVELFFHCSERCQVDAAGNECQISQEGRTILLKLPQVPDAMLTMHYGSVAPIAGWISRRFDVKQPAPTLQWRARLQGATVLQCEIGCR